MDSTSRVIKAIIADIRVEVSEEFDRNFERQSFFNEAWQRRKSPIRGDGHILVQSGALRRSITSTSDENSITFRSTLPYAAIHNEGGEIKVTVRMKKYFWARYYEAVGGFGRKKNGSLRNDRRNARLSSEADYWKALALMKVGSSVKIPRRRFIGTSPELEKAVTDIIERNLTRYFEDNIEKITKK